MAVRKPKATTPTDIFKRTHEEILISAKRKHTSTGEFFLFKTILGTDTWYSESSSDIYGDAIEHWKKINGRWQKVEGENHE